MRIFFAYSRWEQARVRRTRRINRRGGRRSPGSGMSEAVQGAGAFSAIFKEETNRCLLALAIEANAFILIGASLLTLQ